MDNNGSSKDHGQAAVLRKLAWFRYELRKFLRFSEQASRSAGITPQQHQLMLGIGGYTGRGWATVSELADFLQERHNAVVMLVERAAKKGLVTKKHDAADRRFVAVSLTPRGASILVRLSALHKQEVARLQRFLATAGGYSLRTAVKQGSVRSVSPRT